MPVGIFPSLVRSGSGRKEFAAALRRRFFPKTGLERGPIVNYRFRLFAPWLNQSDLWQRPMSWFGRR